MGSNRFQPTPTKANGHNFGHSKEPGIGTCRGVSSLAGTAGPRVRDSLATRFCHNLGQWSRPYLYKVGGRTHAR